jgi:glutamate synthase domain-containing protein 1
LRYPISPEWSDAAIVVRAATRLIHWEWRLDPKMCGIAGYLSLTDRDAPAGRTMARMLGALGRRGPDSAGVALFRAEPLDHEVCWVRLPDDPVRADQVAADLTRRLGPVADVTDADRRGSLVRVELHRHATPAELCAAVERPDPDVEVVSLGRSLELVKDVGTPDNLDVAHHVSGWRGSHAIGHTRLSTESRVDLSHSQPFWARGVPDLATVHNGHITNYHRLRRIYEQQGVRFFTENDSEVIAVYLADQLARGRSLEEAIVASLDDLDGSFTYLVASPDAIGYARDPFALKPLIWVETPDHVAIANEEVAIRAALGDAGVAHEPTGHVYRLWHRAPVAAAAAA